MILNHTRSPLGSPIVIRTTRDLSAYLNGKPVVTPSPKVLAIEARIDAVIRMAVTGR